MVKTAGTKKTRKNTPKKQGSQDTVSGHQALGKSTARPAHTGSNSTGSGSGGNTARVLRRLKADYPEVRCALNYRSPFQLLVATILSAQCTDVRVNLVTRDLFRKYRTPAMFAKATQKELEACIKSTGFFRNKAKNIKACSLALLEKHGGKVPRRMEPLVALPGVGRKTANVVLGTAFRLASGIAVDTHVGRLSRRLGLSSETDPVKVERDLMEQLPKKEWIDFSHRMIYHGRAVCNARKPLCDVCSMRHFCPHLGAAISAENVIQ